MSERQLQKWHGAGNEFLVDVTTPAEAEWWTPQRAAAACVHVTGIGADGLLVAVPTGEELTMVLFNADGSRAEMSGNGIRCLVAAYRRDSGDDREIINVHTDAGVRAVTLHLDGVSGFGEVEMGTVTLEQPVVGSLGVANVGNPHVVVRDNPDWELHQREELASDLADPLGGANVEFVTVLDTDRVGIVVLERGVGWTQACGTGSVAAAAVLRDLGEVSDVVIMENPGGDLTVTLGEETARLAGPVQFMFDVTWSGE